jgi:sugar phosphate isomerase/epimerase
MSVSVGSAESPSHLPLPALPLLKQRFAFRLATTSYIIPEAILPNIAFLGPHFDEIELVLFESQDLNNLPTPAEIRKLVALAEDFNLTYNIHLPGDVFLGDPDPALRQAFCTTAINFYERTLALNPTAYILHLDSRKADGEVEADRAAWRQQVHESLDKMQSKGMDLGRVVVENLEYPLERITPFAEAFGMDLCLDIGHLLRYGHDLGEQLEAFLSKSPMVHLHGVNDGEDHLGLDHIPQQEWNIICRALKEFRGVVSLEVFSVDDLIPSLPRIQKLVRGEEHS